jgi:hypothetical protein
MTTAIQSQRTIVRFCAASAIIGAILAMIGNGLHPHTTNPTLESVLTLIATRADWVAIHLIIILSIFCILGGLFGVYRSLHLEPAAEWAQLGFAVAVAGSTMVAVNFASDGFAMKNVATLWANSNPSEQAAMLPAAQVLYQANLGFYTVWIFLFLGIPFVLYGLALLQSVSYPRWMGWLGFVSGMGSTVVGIAQYLGGETTFLTNMFVAFSVAITLWMLVIGVSLWRKSNVPPAVYVN